MIGTILEHQAGEAPKPDPKTLIQIWKHNGRLMCKSPQPLSPEAMKKLDELFALLG